MIHLYRMLSALVYGLVAPFGKRKAAAGNELWQGRLGLNLPRGPVDIWMHAASVGEVKVLGNLISYLRQQVDGLTIHVTTVTATGLQTARESMGDSMQVSFFPLDATVVINRTLDQLQPKMIVVAETEIWPNLIRLAFGRQIPVVLVNGRMSEKALGKYRLIKGSLRKLLAMYDRFFFKSGADRDRYARFGITEAQSEVAGDMKFDLPAKPISPERVAGLRQRLGLAPDDFLFLAGSTRPGEESILIDAFGKLAEKHPQLRLGLAPRHLERLDEVRQLLTETGLEWCAVDDGRSCKQVVLVDRMGILSDLYEAADLAFVGGTLVDIGGHNILEPIQTRTPVLFGPYLSNVQEAAEYITRHDFGAKVETEDQLVRLVDEVISGRKQFRANEGDNSVPSATAIVGQYILEKLNRA